MYNFEPFNEIEKKELAFKKILDTRRINKSDKEMICNFLEEEKQTRIRKEEEEASYIESIFRQNEEKWVGKINTVISKMTELLPVPFHEKIPGIVIDTETTGLDPIKDEILSISLIDMNGNVLLDTLVKPYYTESWPEAMAVNKISPEMVKNAPYMHQILPGIIGIISAAEICAGYNHQFDLKFLNKFGVPTPPIMYDVMRHYAPIHGQWDAQKERWKYCKLTVCANELGYEFEPHSSLEDCKATLFAYKKLVKMETEGSEGFLN